MPQVLMGLNKLWELNLSQKELINLGKKLGSDVAYFVVGGHSWKSRGDKAGEFENLGKLMLLAGGLLAGNFY